MKRLVVGIVVSVSIVTGALVVMREDDQTPMQTNTTPVSEVAKNIRQDPTTPGKYIPYSEEDFVSATGVKLLFFYADWCRQCQDIETSIEKQGLPDSVTIFKVPYDTATQLRKKYGVTLQTTFVKVTNTGELIEKYVAYEQPHIDSVIAVLL